MKMLKTLILGGLLFSVTGCAGIMNRNKPDLRNSEAINSAYHYRVIDYSYKYFIGDIALAFIPFVGFVAAPAGFVMDAMSNDAYYVIDQAAYKAWEKQYKAKQYQERNAFMHQDFTKVTSDTK